MTVGVYEQCKYNIKKMKKLTVYFYFPKLKIYFNKKYV